MIEAQYKVRSGRITFKVAGELLKSVFREIAQIQEVFDADPVCGACESAHTIYRTRTVEGNDFYEAVCLDCRARLQFGQHKTGGTLFAKRKDENGAWLPNNGWVVYQKD